MWWRLVFIAARFAVNFVKHVITSGEEAHILQTRGSCRLMFLIRSPLSIPTTSSSTGSLPIRFLPKMPNVFWHSCSKHQTSCDTYHTRRGCGTSSELRPMGSHHRLVFLPRPVRYRSTLVSGQLGVRLYPNADGSQAMSTYADTSKEVPFSSPFSLWIMVGGLVFGYRTSSKVAITIFTMGTKKLRLGERRRHISVST
jgi:hypothetical protein